MFHVRGVSPRVLYNGALATPVMQLKLLLKSEMGDWLFESDSEVEGEGNSVDEGKGEGESESESEAEGGAEGEGEATAVCRGSPGIMSFVSNATSSVLVSVANTAHIFFRNRMRIIVTTRATRMMVPTTTTAARTPDFSGVFV